VRGRGPAGAAGDRHYLGPLTHPQVLVLLGIIVCDTFAFGSPSAWSAGRAAVVVAALSLLVRTPAPEPPAASGEPVQATRTS
jgi:hypothetical protein